MYSLHGSSRVPLVYNHNTVSTRVNVDRRAPTRDATNISFSSSGRSKEEALQAEVNRLTLALQKKDEEFEAKVEAEVQLRLAEMLPEYNGAQSDTTEQTDVLPTSRRLRRPTAPRTMTWPTW